MDIARARLAYLRHNAESSQQVLLDCVELLALLDAYEDRDRLLDANGVLQRDAVQSRVERAEAVRRAEKAEHHCFNCATEVK